MKLPCNLNDGLIVKKNLLDGTTLERSIITRRKLFRHGRLLKLKEILAEKRQNPYRQRNQQNQDGIRGRDTILLETIFDNGGKTIERLSHVDGSSRNVNGLVETV